MSRGWVAPPSKQLGMPRVYIGALHAKKFALHRSTYMRYTLQPYYMPRTTHYTSLLCSPPRNTDASATRENTSQASLSHCAQVCYHASHGHLPHELRS